MADASKASVVAVDLVFIKSSGGIGVYILTKLNRTHQMVKLRIPHKALIFVGDGRKAMFLRNEGDEKFPNLRAERVFEDDNPLTHEQGSERPGRVSKALESGQRSAVEPVDWHQIEERHFVRKVAAAMEQVVRTGAASALIIVAPPKTLAELRGDLHADVKARVIAEINKDLTKHPIVEIEKHLTAWEARQE